ncbi:hypothetical protein BZL30_1223 [Mycobacterium kansasii]|uniref:Uncharacterized protein n=1 Tax=Mycobacterium kansasii TaxID=1768 RepID=A0A1V3XSX6_MYCKA|nr:hypothetical protein BZL30_1223 [Mycobacterium kansasii]
MPIALSPPGGLDDCPGGRSMLTCVRFGRFAAPPGCDRRPPVEMA